jgi:hypothetical protein
MKNKQIKKIYKNTSHVHRQLIKEYFITKKSYLLSEGFVVGLPLAEAGITFAGNQAIVGAFRGSIGSSVSCLAGNIQTWYSGISNARGMAQLTSFLNGGTSQGMSRVLAQLTKSVGRGGGEKAAMEVLKVIRSSTNPAMQQLGRTLAYEGGQFVLQVPGAGSTLGPGISVAAAAAAALAITAVVFAAPIALAAYSLKNDIVSRIEYLHRISGSAVQGIAQSPVKFEKMIAKGSKYDKEMISLLPFMFDSEANLLDTARTPAGIKPEDVDAKVFEVANDLIALINDEKLDLESTRAMFKARYLDPATKGAEEGVAAAEEALKESEENKSPEGSEESTEKESKDKKEKESKPKTGKKKNSTVQEIQKIVGAKADGLWGPNTANACLEFAKKRITAVDGVDVNPGLEAVLKKYFKENWKGSIVKAKKITVGGKNLTPDSNPEAFKPTVEGMLRFLQAVDDMSGDQNLQESRGNLYRKRYHGRY